MGPGLVLFSVGGALLLIGLCCLPLYLGARARFLRVTGLPVETWKGVVHTKSTQTHGHAAAAGRVWSTHHVTLKRGRELVTLIAPPAASAALREEDQVTITSRGEILAGFQGKEVDWSGPTLERFDRDLQKRAVAAAVFTLGFGVCGLSLLAAGALV